MKRFGERHVTKNINELPGHDYVWSLNYIRDYQDINKVEVIADISCGTGSGSFFISKQIEKNVIGVDYSIGALKHAKNLFKNHEFYPNFVAMDCHFLAFKNNSIDIIISIGTIEHLQHVNLFLKETKRVLKENGLLIITTPNKNFSSPGLKKPVNLYHIKEYSLSELKDILNKFYQKFEIYGLQLDCDSLNRIKTYRRGFRYRLGIRIGQLEIFRKIFRFIPNRLKHILAGVPTITRSYDNYSPSQNNLDNSAQFNVIIKNSKI
ncbi:2-methoxy-6-polyprenyl-1,4-benzoquinol methylase [subsurface metagenome]